MSLIPVDTTPPSSDNCPEHIVETVELGVSGTTVVWGEPLATDTSGVVTLVSSSHEPGSFFSAGVSTVTYTFSDSSGNEYECSFDVTVVTGEECLSQ